MLEQQLDLFAGAETSAPSPLPQGARPLVVTADMDEGALLDAIPESSLGDSTMLAAEAGRRRLAAAIPALTELCRRFAGFGVDRTVPEQAAALTALADIGGRDAADAVAQFIERGVVCGPTLKIAVNSAARLRARLSEGVLQALLQHADPAIRADTCRCSRPFSRVITRLIDLLNDIDQPVARAAACALGQMGRIEARPRIKSLLHNAPTKEVLDAAALIADEEIIVLLGRIARAGLSLSGAALDALETIDHPRASAIAADVRRPSQPEGSAL
ncbi:MAG TPA: HEAT repeat domain-containing protein [Xanthobacteraceae bacterium]